MAEADGQENYFAAGDFDSRNRYLRKRAGGNFIVCSGVTWELGVGVVHLGASWVPWRWALGARMTQASTSARMNGETVTRSVATPSPANITDCTI